MEFRSVTSPSFNFSASLSLPLFTNRPIVALNTAVISEDMLSSPFNEDLGLHWYLLYNSTVQALTVKIQKNACEVKLSEMTYTAKIRRKILRTK